MSHAPPGAPWEEDALPVEEATPPLEDEAEEDEEDDAEDDDAEDDDAEEDDEEDAVDPIWTSGEQPHPSRSSATATRVPTFECAAFMPACVSAPARGGPLAGGAR
jgi:hypothetical protein